jgi:hypothetical protein
LKVKSLTQLFPFSLHCVLKVARQSCMASALRED